MPKSDSLAEYLAKRNLKSTSEPSGKGAKSKHDNRFIVQKHDASNLHWDLRLQADGVLKSWAVTKGPSLDPDIRRLAVRTEDHPLDYADFEGTIPRPDYGGGTVMLWDDGTWEPVEGQSWKDIDNGHLHFRLDGQRMKGEWLLVRLKPKGRQKGENWLLRKLKDRYAGQGDALIERELTSVRTGRSMAEIAAGKSTAKSTGTGAGKSAGKSAGKTSSTGAGKNKGMQASTGRLPAFREPQLATLVEAVPAAAGWMHEVKFDGYRALVACAGSKVRIYTRSGKDWTDRFPVLVDQLARLELPTCLIDGEIIASDSQAKPDFSSLQAVLKRGHGTQSARDTLSFQAFDLLELDGEDIADLPNSERKNRLETLLVHAGPPIHVTEHVTEQVAGAGEKLYRWMCESDREGIVSKKMEDRYVAGRSMSWVKVKCSRRQEFIVIGWKSSSAPGRPFASLLLAQYDAGELAYKGNAGTGFTRKLMEELASTMKRLERKTPPADVDRASSRDVTWLTPKLVAEITHRKRVMFPDSGQTKGELADYYAAVAPIMLPYLAHRPVSLVRCPQGRAKKCFFQKHHSGSFGDAVHAVPVQEKGGDTEDYLYIDDARGLQQCTQMSTVEFHGWAARCSDVEAPDRLVFDLDPDEGLDFDLVKQAAIDVRRRLRDLHLESFAMLTGGKGVHVIVPLSADHSWDEHQDFAREFAESMAGDEPERFTASMSKARRKGKIFIDWMRNQRGSTSVLPYSVRARGGAPVAAPVAWNELDRLESAQAFSMDSVRQLIRRARSRALAGWGISEQSLP